MNVELIERLKAIPGVVSVELREGSLWVEGPLLDVEAMADTMAALAIRMLTITAIPQSVHGETAIIYHYADERKVINFKTGTRNGMLTSLAPKARAASWAEREIKDLFAVEFSGHPNPLPLLKPKGFEDGMLREAMCGPVVLAKTPASRLAVEAGEQTAPRCLSDRGQQEPRCLSDRGQGK